MASEQISGSASSVVGFLHQLAADFGATYSAEVARSYTKVFGITDVTKLWFGNVSVTNTPVVLNLSAMSADAFGNTPSLTTVKQLLVWNKDTTNDVTVGGGSQPFLPSLPSLKGQSGNSLGSDGSCYNFTSLLPATSGSANLLRLVGSSSGACSVDVLIAGT